MDIFRRKKIAKLESELAALKHCAGRSVLWRITLNPSKLVKALLPIVPSIQVDCIAFAEDITITLHAEHDAAPLQIQQATTILKQLIDVSVTGVLRDS
jgi:hypothetical protein